MTTSGENQKHETAVTHPLSVIENFFLYVHLHEAKHMMNEVKEQLLHNNYPNQQGTIPYDNTLYFFEKLEELLNAAYLLHRRH